MPVQLNEQRPTGVHHAPFASSYRKEESRKPVMTSRRQMDVAHKNRIRGRNGHPLTPSTAAKAEYGCQSDLTADLPNTALNTNWGGCATFLSRLRCQGEVWLPLASSRRHPDRLVTIVRRKTDGKQGGVSRVLKKKTRLLGSPKRSE